MKFLCSYGGSILPRYGDGKLRYVGGLTRVLAADRSVSLAELTAKFGEFCGYSVQLRCQLPGGDLETLVSIKSDDELALLIEEYDRSCPGSKIRAVLSPVKLLRTISPSSSIASGVYLRLSRTSTPPTTTGSPLRQHRNNVELRYYPRRGQGNPRFLPPEHCCSRNYPY